MKPKYPLPALTTNREFAIDMLIASMLGVAMALVVVEFA